MACPDLTRGAPGSRHLSCTAGVRYALALWFVSEICSRSASTSSVTSPSARLRCCAAASRGRQRTYVFYAPAGHGRFPILLISLALILAEEDPLVPYRGGQVARERGAVLSAQETVALFRRMDRCKIPGTERQVPDTDPGDGTTTSLTGWSGCADVTEVRLSSVRGGGHTWPGPDRGGHRRFPRRRDRPASRGDDRVPA